MRLKLRFMNFRWSLLSSAATRFVERAVSAVRLMGGRQSVV
jgi:hypothetical protein